MVSDSIPVGQQHWRLGHRPPIDRNERSTIEPPAWHDGRVSLPNTSALIALAEQALSACGAAPLAGGSLTTRTPITGARLGGVEATVTVDQAVERATTAFGTWRTTPAPQRGELVLSLIHI